MAVTTAKSAYTSSSVATATPAQLLIMLLDRLVLDIERGARAMLAKDSQEANRQYVHAQAIVTALQSSLQVEGWRGGRELMSLYNYLQRRIIQANVRKDAQAAKEALGLARHITETWKMCAAKLGEKLP